MFCSTINSVKMIMKTLLVSLFVVVLAMGTSMAADDPMQSLFLFQQQMADGGNPAAMMKLGEMYERGEGTTRDLDKAREMYDKAKAKGHPKADAALSKLDKQQARVNKQAQKEKAAKDKAAKEKAAKEKAAQEKLAREQAAKEKAARQQAAKEQARKDAQAKSLAAEREKARAELERQKAAFQQAAREKAAREKAAKEKAKRDALARKKQDEAARRAAQQKAAQQKLAQQKAAARKKAEKEAGKIGFKSDPCKGAAARVMSTCKK